MNFLFKMPENGRKNIFREKETTKSVNVTSLAALKKQIRCSSCSWSVNFKKINVVDAI